MSVAGSDPAAVKPVAILEPTFTDSPGGARDARWRSARDA
jgi:hypothetical protein